MKKYKKILCPVDGSPLSDLAFENAISLAKMTDGTVTVIHVIEPVTLNYSGFEEADMATSLGIIQSENVKSVKEMLSNYVKMGEKEDVEVKNDIIEGSVSNEIVRLSNKFDIIIMGTQGRNMLSSLFLGSVAEKVARHACCPVTLVRKFKDDCHRRLKEN